MGEHEKNDLGQNSADATMEKHGADVVGGHTIVGKSSFSACIYGEKILRDIVTHQSDYRAKMFTKENILKAIASSNGKAPLKIIDDMLVETAKKLSMTPAKYLDYEAIREYSNASIYSNDINCSGIANKEIRQKAEIAKKNIEDYMKLSILDCCKCDEKWLVDKPETEVPENVFLQLGDPYLNDNPNKKMGTVYVAQKTEKKERKGAFKKLRMGVLFDSFDVQKEKFVRSIGETVFRIRTEEEGGEFREEDFNSWYGEFRSALIEGNIRHDESNCVGKLASTVSRVLNAKAQGIATLIFYEAMIRQLGKEHQKNEKNGNDEKKRRTIFNAGKFIRAIATFERARITEAFDGSPNNKNSLPFRLFNSILDVLPSEMMNSDAREYFCDAWNRWFDGGSNTYNMHGFSVKSLTPESSCNLFDSTGNKQRGSSVSNVLSIKMNGKIQNIANYGKAMVHIIEYVTERIEETYGNLVRREKGFAIPSYDFHLLKANAKIASAIDGLKNHQGMASSGKSSCRENLDLLVDILVRFFQFHFTRTACLGETKIASDPETIEFLVDAFLSKFESLVLETKPTENQSESDEDRRRHMGSLLWRIAKEMLDEFRNIKKENTQPSIVEKVHDFSDKAFFSDLIADNISFDANPIDVCFTVDIRKMCSKDPFGGTVIDVGRAYDCYPFLNSPFNATEDEISEEKEKPGIISKYVHVRFADKDGKTESPKFGICSIPAKIFFSADAYEIVGSFEMNSESTPPEKNIFLAVGYNETDNPILAKSGDAIPFLAGVKGTKISYVSNLCEALRLKIDGEGKGETPEAILLGMVYTYLKATFFKVLSEVVKSIPGEETILSIAMVKIHEDGEDGEDSPLSKICIAIQDTLVSYINGLKGCIAISQGIKASNVNSRYPKDAAEFSFIAGFPQTVTFTIKNSEFQNIGALSRKTAIVNMNSTVTDRIKLPSGNKRKYSNMCGVLDMCSTIFFTPSNGEFNRITVSEKRFNPQYRIKRMDENRHALDMDLFESVIKNCREKNVERVFLFARIPGSGVIGAYSSVDDEYGMPTGNLFFMDPLHINRMMVVAKNYGIELITGFSNDSEILSNPKDTDTTNKSYVMFEKQRKNLSQNADEERYGTLPFFAINTIKPFKSNINPSYFSHGTMYSCVLDKKGLYQGALLFRDRDTGRDLATILTALHFTRSEKKSSSNIPPLKQNALETVANLRNKKALISRGAIVMKTPSQNGCLVNIFLPAFIAGMERTLNPVNGSLVFVTEESRALMEPNTAENENECEDEDKEEGAL